MSDEIVRSRTPNLNALDVRDAFDVLAGKPR
jgi:hypothetical protein